MMDRRVFITMVGGSILAAPLAGEAQLSRKVRVGWLLPDPKPFALGPFRQELKERGWIEGDNLVIEERYSHSVAQRYLELTAGSRWMSLSPTEPLQRRRPNERRRQSLSSSSLAIQSPEDSSQLWRVRERISQAWQSYRGTSRLSASNSSRRWRRAWLVSLFSKTPPSHSRQVRFSRLRSGRQWRRPHDR